MTGTSTNHLYQNSNDNTQIKNNNTRIKKYYKFRLRKERLRIYKYTIQKINLLSEVAHPPNKSK